MAFYVFSAEFSKANSPAVTPPDAAITNRSAGARIIPGMLSKKIPVPKLYRLPFSRIISPRYIKRVIPEAIIAGSHTDRKLPFSNRNEPAKIPTVTPSRMKNRAISIAERGDTCKLPSRQNAVKHAKIQRPRNRTVLTDWGIKDRSRLFSPVISICPKP